MLVISNTSPLLYLNLTGRLRLLSALYKEIVIPPAVQAELAEGAARGIDVPRPADLPWIRVVPLRSRDLLPLVTDLGAGETEAIGLALEHPGSRLIIDDQLGRRIARSSGLTVTGTLGVLLKAKADGLLPSIAPLLEDLRRAGLWLSDDLIDTVLAQAGERTGSSEGGIADALTDS